MATAVELVFLPEVDHVHQQLSADAAHEARWMPELIVAGAVCVHRWGPFSHLLVAVEAQLQDGETRNINQKNKSKYLHQPKLIIHIRLEAQK